MSHAARLPRYLEIANELRSDIDAGRFPTGSSLPSEAELCRRFDVAPGTVRQSLRALVLDGTLHSRRGARKVVMRNSRPAVGFNEFRSFAQWAYSQGAVPGGQVLEQVWLPASELDRRMLALEPDATVLSVKRLRTLGGNPVMLEHTHYTPDIGRRVESLRPDAPSVTNLLSELFGVEFVAADHVFSVGTADEFAASTLSIAVGAPLLHHRRVSRDRTGTPLEWSQDSYVAGTVSLAVSNTRDSNSLSWVSAIETS